MREISIFIVSLAVTMLDPFLWIGAGIAAYYSKSWGVVAIASVIWCGVLTALVSYGTPSKEHMATIALAAILISILVSTLSAYLRKRRAASPE